MTHPLQGSSELLGDGAALRARLVEDGYLFFPRLLESEVVQQVRRAILERLADLGWLAEGSDPSEARPGDPPRREGLGDWWPGYVAIQSLEPFHALAYDEALLGVMALLSPGELLVHPRKIARATYPGSQYPTPPHQDFPLIQGCADTFTAWVPFGRCSAEMGG